MRNTENIGNSYSRILNISGIPDGEVTNVATISETIRIKVIDLTPGIYTIPVRIESAFNSSPFERLEEIVRHGLATKEEFRALGKMCSILNS